MRAPVARGPQTSHDRRWLYVGVALAAGLAVVGVVLYGALTGPHVEFFTPFRQDAGFFRIEIRSVSPQAPLQSWAVRVLERGEEAIPLTSVQTLRDEIAGFQPHVEFRDGRSWGEEDGLLSSGDAFFVGNLAVGWTYTIELTWVASGATVARADFVEPG